MRAVIATLVSAGLIAACSLGALDGFSGGATSSSSGNPEGGASSGADGSSSTSTSTSSSSGGDAQQPGTDAPADAPVGNSYRDLVMSDGPAAYWRLGEASGLTAKDETGKYPGGYQGGYTLGATTIVDDGDTAVAFAGTNGRVSIGDVLDFQGNVPISLEAWIFLDVIDADYKRVIGKRGQEGGYSIFCQQNADGCAFEIIGAGGATAVCEVTMQVGQWHHFVGTYDGATARAYRDGIEVCSQVKAVSFQKVNAPLVLGAWSMGGGNWFKGRIDEVAVYDKALPIARIAAHSSRRKQ